MNINKKGYIYTLSTVILILILIFFILFYSRFTETEMEDISGKIRCDELHFFVEDTKVDVERGLMITGRRAAIYAISNQIMGQNLIDADYEFNCTPLCKHCSSFNYSGQGAEAAIAELMFCGTLHGIQNEYMEEHTIEKWIEKLESRAGTANFDVGIFPTKLKIAPYDAWDFTSSVDLTLNISDTEGMCYFSLYHVTIGSMASVEGLEDVSYALNTDRKAVKTVRNCEIEMHATELSPGGTNGWGWAVGDAVLINNDSDADDKLPDADESKIVVINCFDDNCFVLNDTSHINDLKEYGGIITTSGNDTTINGLDNLSIPYLAGTSINEITENMSIILLASKYYFIDINLNGTCDVTNCAIYNENGTCMVDQLEWFLKPLQVCNVDNHYPVEFLFPETQECQITPQLEDSNNNTWYYNLSPPAKAKNLHLIGASNGKGDYELIIYYSGNTTKNYSVEIQDHCSSAGEGNCTDCGGRGYDSHFVSRNNNSGYIFEDVFGNTSGSEACGDGETVLHITAPLNKDKYVERIAIRDPDNSTGGDDPAIWAVTIEMAPMSVWELNYTSALFMCYNLSKTGPSFLDRIENNKNTTNKYQNQTNNTLGIESFLSIGRLQYYGVNVSSNKTAMDYLYFYENKTGYPLIGTNESGIDYFRIDIDYALSYEVYDLINWKAYISSIYGSCAYDGEYCQKDGECCGILICFEEDAFCGDCLGIGENCYSNATDTYYNDWCCSVNCSITTERCV